jgi:hypothetical protein
LPTILSTHSYLDENGTREANPALDSNHVDEIDNSPEEIWEKLIRNNDQIFLVLCGHNHGQAVRIDKNDQGNEVYQLMVDFSKENRSVKDYGRTPGPRDGVGDGWLRLMRFNLSKDDSTIEIKNYSTYYKEYGNNYGVIDNNFSGKKIDGFQGFTIKMNRFYDRYNM